MKFKFAKYFIPYFTFFYHFSGFCFEEMSFPKIWEQIVKSSPENKSINYMKLSSEKSVSRQSLNWLPSFYLNSQLISTNDPTLTFMNYLGEGQVKQDDFIPSHLNAPSNNIFNSTQTGIDFLIYDGSVRSSSLNSQIHLSKSLEYEKKAELISLYVRALREYIKILLTQEYNKELKSIQNNVENIINNYRLGEKSNPIGYSGFLSLKSILNKILIINQDCELTIKNAKITINIMAGTDKKEWVVKDISTEKFSSLYFLKTENSLYSYKYLSELENTAAIKEKVKLEEAKYLPKFGVFSQANIYAGDRDTNTAYVFGLYIKFNIAVSDFGSADEVELLAKSKEESAKVVINTQKILNDSSNESLIAIKNKLQLLDKSEEILNEQVAVISKLFKNGTTSVSQISELYNKKIDLINTKYSLKNYLYESELAKVSLSKKSVEPKDIWSIK